MSSTEPPAGSVPPDPTTPPPPPASSTPPPPPPPTGGYGTSPSYGAPPPPAPGYAAGPAAAYGVGSPGNLVDRFVARLLDLIIVGIVGFVINLVLALVSDSYLLSSFVSAIVDTALYLGYFGYLESTGGQTIGKMVMKLKTFGPDGQRVPTMQEAIRRNIWLGVAILGIVPILGGIVAFIVYVVSVILCAVGINSDTVRRQHWFDKFAGGTQVIKVG